MSRKAKKYIVILLTALLSAAAFTITAFAQAEILPDSSAVSHSAASEQASSASEISSAPSAASGESSAPAGSESAPADSGNGGVDVPGSGADITVKLNYNDGQGIRTLVVQSGTTVGALPVPARKGYRFVCWTAAGTEVASSMELYSDMTLTARWEAAAQSSSSRPSSSSSYTSVDTRQNEVNQAASQAQQVISDPGVLSSEDWNSILSTGSQAQAAGTQSSSQASSSQASGGKGSSSWLLPVGIALIALAACGVGAFVYLQFFSGDGHEKPDPRGGGGDGGDATMEFTDISSFSDGSSVYHSPDAPETAGNGDDTRPIRTPDAQSLDSRDDGRGTPRAEAKAVESGKKDFDWDKFFNDDI